MTTAYRYGEHLAQVADLHLPEGRDGSAPVGVALLVHGGFWRARYDRSLMAPIAADLVAAGWAVWNVDYRAVGAGPSDGGGWPRTYLDVAAAADLLAEVGAGLGLPLDHVVAVGHSAGGALALWLAGRHRLPPGAVGALPRTAVSAVVAQGAVCDLAAAARDRLGAGAVQDLIGAGQDAAAAYATASPAALLPLGVPILLVTGDRDDAVPHGQSVAFAAAARAAGDDVQLEVLPGDGHFVHLDPASAAWQATRTWMRQHVAR